MKPALYAGEQTWRAELEKIARDRGYEVRLISHDPVDGWVLLTAGNIELEAPTTASMREKIRALPVEIDRVQTYGMCANHHGRCPDFERPVPAQEGDACGSCGHHLLHESGLTWGDAREKGYASAGPAPPAPPVSWEARTEEQLEAALSALRDPGETIDAVMGAIELAQLAYRIQLGEAPADEWPDEEPEPECICPPEMRARNDDSFRGGCPVHSSAAR